MKERVLRIPGHRLIAVPYRRHRCICGQWYDGRIEQVREKHRRHLLDVERNEKA